MRWELETNSELSLSRRIIANEIPAKRALDTMQLFIEQENGSHNEKESKILEGFIKGNYTAEKAVDLIKTYRRKKADSRITILSIYYSFAIELASQIVLTLSIIAAFWSEVSS